MAARDTCAYDKLFTKSVPHIHEKIFFFLDYESFKNCKVVCKEWNDFLTSEPFQNKAQSVYFYKIKQEKYKLITYKTEIVANERKLFDCIKKGNAGEVNGLLSIGVDPKCERRQKGAYLGVLDMYRNPQAYTTLLLATEKGTQIWSNYFLMQEQIPIVHHYIGLPYQDQLHYIGQVKTVKKTSLDYYSMQEQNLIEQTPME